MASFDMLREDILDVFNVFDEEGTGSISMQELSRAIYTITGTRISRSDLRSLVQAVQEEMKEEAHARKTPLGADLPPRANSLETSISPNADGENDAVDSSLFVAVVLKTLNRHTYEQELLFTFHLLEDKKYPGFITKDSLKKAAAEMEEHLTDQEVNEMFDKLVTGISSSAVDFTTFTSVLEAAKRMDD
ncbi:caltractin [Trypanosoma cruzi Dm28c]|uniref:Caltractin n=2 Tax=Trypanosoma cruzi TaxID=5693 RepID=V5BH45_TRYCR|nr:caltractin [Trypanosoma cruzi Dm28c]KAF8287839.1 putative caltractin [Trypanosoma cruzi]PBJ67849.1 caltractin [Trypanosoma cruzi cruzi]PWU87111.1 putative caltractin [Trypanosoma cruzi]